MSAPQSEPTPSYRMTEFYITIVLAILVIIITFLLSKKFKKTSNVVLLTGLSDAGKTALLSKIIFNKPKKSVTSLKESEATIQELNLRLVDLPGADRLRTLFWEKYRAQARHVIFVIDSTTVESNIRNLSEYLYSLLADGILYTNNIKFTIACNKQDLESALKKDSIKEQLEKELSAIRETKKGQLGKTSNEEVEDYIAKIDPKDRTLDALKVDFIETSIYNPEQLVKMIF